MTQQGKQHPFTAQHAARVALGAFYNVSKYPSSDGAELLGAWMLELTSKLKHDDVTRTDFAELIRRWEEDENQFFSRLKGNRLHVFENAPDNQSLAGVDNG